ncbi:hypothetical protein [Streptomyces sp. NPDC051310]|uniref:hypothetical protein n=1 Tax=Streptomyces sp. NPDC051310 TaxID=3365649 RepID=UPI00379A96C1
MAHGPDGTLAAGDARGAVRLTGPGPFAGTRLDLPGEAAVTALAWTGPAGLVAGTADGTLYGVDVAGRRHHTLAERAATAVVDVRTAPDGTVLAAWKDRVLIRVPGREAVPLKGFASEHVRAGWRWGRTARSPSPTGRRTGRGPCCGVEMPPSRLPWS